MGKRYIKGLKSTVATGIPAVNSRANVFEPYIKRLEFYRSFLEFLGSGEAFQEIAGEVYYSLLDGRGVRERNYQMVLDALEWEVKKRLTEITFDLRSMGEYELARAIERFIEEDDIYSVYSLLIERNREMISNLETYKLILEFFKAETIFSTVSRQVYKAVMEPRYVAPATYEKVERILRAECVKRIQRRVNELRSAAMGREADKVEEYLEKGDLENAYLTLKGITTVKRIEKEKVDIASFIDRYLETSSLLSTLELAGEDVSDMRWKIAELMGTTLTGVPEDKLVLVNDPYGNFGCVISLFMKRIGMKHVFFSSSGVGDFWITNAEVNNRINPNLQASDLGERIIEYDSVVIIEDLNYLILNNKFSEVYRFLYYIKSTSKARIIATVNMKVLSEKERARLHGIANRVIDSQFLLNICSTSIVAVKERPKEGSLLLAKELTEDFKGKVYMIADFGGEKYLHPQRLDFEILDKISDHIERGDVVIDALDMLIDENSIEKIYLWLKFLKDIARLRGNRIYIVTKDLIESEREYLRPLIDFDFMLIANMDQKKVAKLQMEMSNIKRALDKLVEKECLYNIESIKNMYAKYRNHLMEFRDDVESIKSVKSFDYQCLVKSAPIRRKMERRIEEIEKIISEFNEIASSLKSLIPIFQVYTDASELQKCVGDAETLLRSGNHTGALESIQECNAALNRYYRRVLSKAWRLRNEILCVDYLLPPYHREKVEEFEGDRERLRDFTLLAIGLRSLIKRKIEMEYNLLKEYSEISGIELFELPEIDEQNYCEYRKKRDEFMAAFDAVREDIIKRMKEELSGALKFLIERGYNIKAPDVDAMAKVEELLDMRARVGHHLVRYATNYLLKIRELCPLCVESIEFDEEAFSNAPFEHLEDLKKAVQLLDEKMKMEEKELMKITEEIKGYYAVFREHGVEFDEVYPRTIQEGRDILSSLETKAESLVPVLVTQILNWSVDESRTLFMKVSIKNMSEYPAVNVSLEFHGAFTKKVEVGTVGKGEVKLLEVSGDVRDISAPVNMDIIYESISGKINTRSATLDINIKGYTMGSSTGTEKCALCRGKIFKDSDMVICDSCGAKYHIQCARRAGKCKVCGHVFLFEEE